MSRRPAAEFGWSFLAAVSVLVTLGPPIAAQEPALALDGRHLIRLGLGMAEVTGQVSVSAGGGAVVHTGIQPAGQIGYRYWFAEGWAVGVDAGALSLDSEVIASPTETSVASTTTSFLSVAVRAQPLSTAGRGSKSRAGASRLPRRRSTHSPPGRA
jgi:hypothetical protein